MASVGRRSPGPSSSSKIKSQERKKKKEDEKQEEAIAVYFFIIIIFFYFIFFVISCIVFIYGMIPSDMKPTFLSSEFSLPYILRIAACPSYATFLRHW